MNTNKTTYKTAVEYAINNLPDAPDDILEKLQNLQIQLEKKSVTGGERKPSKEQMANTETAIAIADFLKQHGEKTSAELRAECPECMSMTPQKLTGVCKRGIEEGILSKREDKRRIYYNAL